MKKKKFTEDKLIEVGQVLSAQAMEKVVGGVNSNTTGDTAKCTAGVQFDTYDPSSSIEYDTKITTAAADR